MCRDLNLEFEIPFRELGFHGVPHKSTAFVMPTVNCLVELVEVPATVVAMPAVAIVNLERVGFNLRNFDMVIVFKVWLHAWHPIATCVPASLAADTDLPTSSFSLVVELLASVHPNLCKKLDTVSFT